MRYILLILAGYALFILLWSRFWNIVGDPPPPRMKRHE